MKYHKHEIKIVPEDLGEDDDIIRSFEQAQAKGMTAREWLRALFVK